MKKLSLRVKKGSGAPRKSLLQIVTSIKFIVSLAVVVAAATLVAWTYHNSTNADRIFWGMVDSSLQTTAYTRHTQQKNASQSVDQILQTSTQPVQEVYAETVFEQSGVDAAQAITENIGTPTYDYVRYTSITTSQKDAQGKPLDFSSVLNLWGVTQVDDESQTTGQLYNQAVLGLIPIGNLNASQRRELIGAMRDHGAYSYKITKTTRSWPFGRPTYTFSVTIKPVPYITALKQYAAAVGLNHLEQIDPEQYASAQQLAFDLTIDGWTHQATSTMQGGGAKTESVSGYNLKKTLPAAPEDAISVDELQTKLQSVQ